MCSPDKPQQAEQLLTQDHAALDELFHTLLASLDEGNTTEFFAGLDIFWARLAIHIRAEHLHLFPAILSAMESGSKKGADVPLPLKEARETVARLRDDHDFFMHELAIVVNMIRKVLREHPGQESMKQLAAMKQKVVSVGDRLKKHNELEEESVYLLPTTLLDASEQILLAKQVRQEIENLPPRFNVPCSDSSSPDSYGRNADS